MLAHRAPPQGNAASRLRASAGDLALLAIELGRPTLLDSALAREMVVVLANGGTAGDAVAEVALRAVGGPSYWAEE